MAPYEEGLVLLAPLVVDAPGTVEAVREYVQTEHLYNIQCSEIFPLRNEKLHTET